ncbi:hypothetical protein ACOMHN_001713 [Nucella lapillus]
MFSLLMSALLFSGLSMCLFLIPPVAGENCTEHIWQDCLHGAKRITNSTILEEICSTQADRKQCYNEFQKRCAPDHLFQGTLDKYDYLCSNSVKPKFTTALDSCLEVEAAIIAEKLSTMCSKLEKPYTCDDNNRYINCLSEVVDDCCPMLCDIQYDALRLYFNPTRKALGCGEIPARFFTCHSTRERNCR